MAEWLTRRQFSKRLGVSRTTLSYAIERDWVHTEMRHGQVRIDFHTEMERYLKNCSPPTALKVRYHLSKSNRQGQADKTQKEGGRYYIRRKHRNKKYKFMNGEYESQSAQTLLDKPLEEMTSMDAGELITVVKAKKAQLAYEKDAGKLIEVEVMEEEWLDVGVKIKSAMLSIPDRVSTMVEGVGHVEIHKILTKEIKHALTNLSQRLKCIDELKED